MEKYYIVGLLAIPLGYLLWNNKEKFQTGGGNGKNVVTEDGKNLYNVDNKYKVCRKCPHRGCLVDYNKEKNEFICPCHGSTFNIEGKLLKGPATKDLSINTC